LKNYLTRNNLNEDNIENERGSNNEAEITKKDMSFFEVTEKKLLNIDDYKNIVDFEESQTTSIEQLAEYYKGLSMFCLWKNYLDEEYCIISTLAGGLIFLRLIDGNHV